MSLRETPAWTVYALGHDLQWRRVVGPRGGPRYFFSFDSEFDAWQGICENWDLLVALNIFTLEVQLISVLYV